MYEYIQSSFVMGSDMIKARWPSGCLFDRIGCSEDKLNWCFLCDFLKLRYNKIIICSNNGKLADNAAAEGELRYAS